LKIIADFGDQRLALAERDPRRKASSSTPSTWGTPASPGEGEAAAGAVRRETGIPSAVSNLASAWPASRAVRRARETVFLRCIFCDAAGVRNPPGRAGVSRA
jgi:hypothetical protein